MNRQARPLAAWHQDTNHPHHRASPSREARRRGRTSARQSIGTDGVAGRSAGAGTDMMSDRVSTTEAREGLILGHPLPEPARDRNGSCSL